MIRHSSACSRAHSIGSLHGLSPLYRINAIPNRAIGLPSLANRPLNRPGTPGDYTLNRPGMSVTRAAALIGSARGTLSRIVNERAGISPEMAIRLEKLGWGEADGWMRLQMNYDLVQVRTREDEIVVGAARTVA